MNTTTSKPYQQMLAKADAELNTLAKQHEQTQARLQAIQAELAALDAAAEARHLRLATTHETVGQLASNYATQQAHASLAVGTLGADAASAHLKEQAKHLDKHKKGLAALLTECEREQERDQAQRLRLEAERDQCSARLGDIRSKRIALEKAKEQAHAELGEAEFRDIVSQIDLVQASIAAKERELTDAQQALREIVSEGVERLGQWPDKQQAIKLQVTGGDDQVLQIAKSQLAHLDKLIALARDLPLFVDLPCTRLRDNWMEVLTISAHELYSYDRVQKNAGLVRKKRAEVAQFIDEYAAKKEGE